jgi:surfactin synthase thioesterase subunit
VAYAGGGSTAYESWQRLLPETMDAQTLRLPGREARTDELLPDDLRGLATDAAVELGPYLTDPFAIFGHSMGALIAYEFAQALRKLFDIEPSCLLVSGMRPPDQASLLGRYEGMDDEELRSAVASMADTSPEALVDSELWELVRPVIGSDLAMCDSYAHVPAEPLRCPLVVYGSKHDDLDGDILNAWGAYTTGPFHTRIFPGDHFYFRRWPDAFAMDLIKRFYRYVMNDLHPGLDMLTGRRSGARGAG